MVDHFQLASSVLLTLRTVSNLANSVMIPEPRGPVQFSYCRTRTYPSISEPWSPSAEINDGTLHTISRLLVFMDDRQLLLVHTSTYSTVLYDRSPDDPSSMD
jgi:hypothetical protein